MKNGLESSSLRHLELWYRSGSTYCFVSLVFIVPFGSMVDIRHVVVPTTCLEVLGTDEQIFARRSRSRT